MPHCERERSFKEDKTDDSSVNEESETKNKTEYESEEEVEDNKDSEDSLLHLWKNLSSPTSEEDVVKKWYACVYRIKGKPRLSNVYCKTRDDLLLHWR